jgi:hypothetical protein
VCRLADAPLACTPASDGKPKRGVSLCSYAADFGITMTLAELSRREI